MKQNLPAPIRNILKKKKWSAKELGIIELSNMAELYRQALAGEPPENIMDLDRFTKAINALPAEGSRIYNGYIAIHNWIGDQHRLVDTYMQIYARGIDTMLQYITNAQTAERAYEYAEQLPAIMTRKEYEEKKQAAVEAFLADGEEIDLYGMVELTISYFLDRLHDNPRAANPLKAVKKKYQQEPCTSPTVLASWNRITRRGYYTLEDGTRSDQMTKKEWQEAITTPKMREVLQKVREWDGEKGYGFTVQALAEKRMITRTEAIFRGASEEDARRAQSEQDYIEGLAMPVTWHYYEEPPADLTKWEVIEQGLYRFFPAATRRQESILDFYENFTEIADVALKEIDRAYDLGAQDVPAKLWLLKLYPYRTLYNVGFFGFRELVESDTVIWQGNGKAQLNGIAIYEPADLKAGRSDPLLDEKGYYRPPQIKEAVAPISLLQFLPEHPGCADSTDQIQEARRSIITGYYYCQGFNAAIDMISQYYEVPGLTAFKRDLDRETMKIQALNTVIMFLYSSIKSRDYEDRELKEKKLEILRRLFAPIEYEKLEIPVDNSWAVADALEDFVAFTVKPTIIQEMLCILPADEEGSDG